MIICRKQGNIDSCIDIIASLLELRASLIELNAFLVQLLAIDRQHLTVFRLKVINHKENVGMGCRIPFQSAKKESLLIWHRGAFFLMGNCVLEGQLSNFNSLFYHNLFLQCSITVLKNHHVNPFCY